MLDAAARCPGSRLSFLFRNVKFRELTSPRIRELHPQAAVLLSEVPGSVNSVEADLSIIEHSEVRFILCLLREAELGTYGKKLQACASDRFRWHHCPIPVSCGLETETALRAGLHALIEELKLGHKVLIHCQLGQVRTGCAAASLLVLLGADAQEAITTVESAGSFAFDDGPLPLFDSFCSPILQA